MIDCRKPVAAAVACAFAAAACGAGPDVRGPDRAIRVDGSSTVAPLSTVAAELFAERRPGARVSVGISGTGGGFEKFCNGEIDIADASRPIKPEEQAACRANGVAYEELQIANDALTIVVNQANTWADCLTVGQLGRMWRPGSTVTSWADLDPAFPDERLTLFGAGTDSGTFDYFTDVINGGQGRSRTDYNPSEDDNITVRGVAGSTGGLGYVGFSYFQENADKLRALAVDGGAGCVLPSVETAQNGTYKPLSRPLFVYPKTASLRRPEVLAFVEHYVGGQARISREALFIPLSRAQENALHAALAELKARR